MLMEVRVTITYEQSKVIEAKLQQIRALALELERLLITAIITGD